MAGADPEQLRASAARDDARMQTLMRVGKKTKMVAATVRRLNAGPVLLVTSTSAIAKAADHPAMRVDLDHDGRIREIHIVVAPKKLHGVGFPRGGGATPKSSPQTA